jgi:hypothetical protein
LRGEISNTIDETEKMVPLQDLMQQDAIKKSTEGKSQTGTRDKDTSADH